MLLKEIKEQINEDTYCIHELEDLILRCHNSEHSQIQCNTYQDLNHILWENRKIHLNIHMEPQRSK